MPRLFVVVRRDLPPATQACQAIHAAVEFSQTHPRLLAPTLALLSVPDELALLWLLDDAEAAQVAHTAFREPDLGLALTAAAFEPAAHRLLAHLPLALATEGR